MKINKAKKQLIIITILFFGIFGLAKSSMAATRYVDGSVSSSGNGQSWATAWKTLGNITGISAGDTVYISGGSTSQTYSASSWAPSGGSAGNPITYKIGQDAGHNGTAIFNCGGSDWLQPSNANVVISGDGGDSNMHFQLSNCSGGIDASGFNMTNVRVAYANFGTLETMADIRGGSSGIELDHNSAQSPTDADRLIYFDTDGTAFGQNKIHDNTFTLVRNNSGLGPDGIQGSAGGTDVYNNSFIANLGTYTSGQHQDGLQPLGTAYLRIYNNYFRDIANYPIFGDAYYGDITHMHVFNNVVVLTSSALQQSDPPQGIAIGPDGGSHSQMGRWPAFNDVVIANNTVADYGGHACVNLENNPGQSSVFTNCVVSNNICLNGGGLGIESGITNANNVTTANGSGHFVSYVALNASNDFHLLSGDALFKDKGTNLSSYFTVDKDSNTRTGTWDIGAYEYQSGGSDTTPPACPVNLTVQ